VRLNWFSPLPPARTDIAHYTARILPALSALADVTLWTEQANWDPSLEKHARICSYRLARMPWLELNRGDVAFYQIGNNPLFHEAIWEISRIHSGVVVLHDFRLHHFFDGLYRVKWRDLDAYLAVMEAYYGEEGRRDAAECFRNHARNIDYMAARYPLTLLAVENALGVIVHSEEAFENLSQQSKWPVACVPLPFPSKLSANSEIVAKGPRDAPPYKLILFGYIGRNRRLDALLEALAGLPERDRFHLDIYGKILDEEKRIRSQIRRLDLKGRVTLHGFTPEAKLDAALSAARLAINLRFPTVGEASGSQLRIWAHALPSLVSQVDWYGSLPSDTVAFVRPDQNEVSDIQKHLKAFLAAPDAFKAMGQRGLKYLQERHSPDQYAQAIMEMARLALTFRRRATAFTLANRTVSKLHECFGTRLPEASLRKVAGEIFALVER
jgi:glycosyltransferase involved in cell wall biosynthesis